MRDSYFEEDFVISSQEHGLKFAFALTAYDENVAWVDESEYGEIQAKYATWGIYGHSYSEVNIPIRQCTEKELGIVEGEEDKSSFFPVHKNSKRSLKYYHRKFMCTDEDIKL